MQKIKRFFKKIEPKTKKQKAVYSLMFLLCVVAVVAGILFFIRQASTSNQPETITYSTNKPDENKPRDDFEWRGLPTDPKKIIIPSIGVNGYIQNVGVDQNKEIAVPNNIHIAGWFVDSVLPGEKGLSIIDGHVDGRQNEGIFKNLEQLNIGDKYTIEFGNGSTKDFKVLDKQSVAVKDSADILFSQKPKVTNQLNLVTCGGDFNRTSNQYAKRIIVASQLVE